jgi:hypothetical protein
MKVAKQRSRDRVLGLKAVAASFAGSADEMKNKLANPTRALGAAFVLAIVSLIASGCDLNCLPVS